MKIPNIGLAEIAKEKITLYLLNPSHPAGGSKASFFLRFGFSAARWQELAGALRQQALGNEVVETDETRYGVRYVVDGVIIAPNGAALNVRSVWYIHPRGSAPTLCDRASYAKIMSEIKELDAVALTCDLPDHGLKKGDVGTAVMSHQAGKAFEVEFVGYDGHTVALVTLEQTQIRPLRASDIPHARDLALA